MDVVGLNGLDHVVHQGLATNVDTPHGTDVAQRVEDAGLALGVNTTKETDDADHTLELDGLETLGKSSSAANLDNVVHTRVVGGQLAGRFAPVGVGLVVDNVVGAELLQLLGLRVRRGSGNDSRTGGFSELYQGRTNCQRIDVSRVRK